MSTTAKNNKEEEGRVTSSFFDRGLASSQSGGVASPTSNKAKSVTKRSGDTVCIGDIINDFTKVSSPELPELKVVKSVLQTYKKPKLSWTISAIRFERYRDYYNSLRLHDNGKPNLKEQLRYSHMLVFKHIVNIAIKEAKEHTIKYSRDYTFSVGEYFEIRTNRPHMSKITGMSGATVKRNLLRLEKSGVIKTQCHGRKANFSIYIDSQFLSFHEINTNPEKQILNAHKEAICRPYSQVHSKNSIINVENSQSLIEPEQRPEQHKNPQEQLIENSIGIDETRTSTRTAQEHTGTKQEPLQGQGMKDDELSPSDCVPRNLPRYVIESPLDKVQDYALDMTHLIFALIMEKLYVNRDIAIVEQIRAIKLIYMQVFRHATNRLKVDQLAGEWKWRVQKVADFMTHRRYSHKGKWIPPTPVYYFDENRAQGNSNFAWSAARYAEHRKKQNNKAVHKELVRRKRDDDYVLDKALLVVAVHKDRESILYQHNFIRNNYPHLVKRFEMTLSDPQFVSVLKSEYDVKQAKVSIKRLIRNS